MSISPSLRLSGDVLSIGGLSERLSVTHHHDVYPTIDPQVHYDAQTYKGKVVLVTGASRGVGLEAALHYARAGASLLLVARQQSTLDESKCTILEETPSATVVTFPADVRDVSKAEEAVATAIKHFGQLDILIANAGIVRTVDQPFASKDPSGWWDVFDVNVRGVYNYVHFSVPELSKYKGKIIIVTSGAAQLRAHSTSEYGTSKHAINRFAEFVALEYPEIKVFSLHPGVIDTELNKLSKSPFPALDTLALSAATFLYLTSGRADFLSGRYFSCNWDLGEVEQLKERIVGENLLVAKLAV
ncbi:NAD-P-binding protein [Auriscalpium vulgare]|uniref:NAD-P-binding protein n=1 Tax=Auriscalpium vulgare TaxID=40419 RepID=A0ACB8S5B5_9AGAM|nr:NAD-P-binding protein [Auriscalpium vulgare]